MDQPPSGLRDAVLYQGHSDAADGSRQALDSMHQNLARELRFQLSAFLRSDIAVEYEGIADLAYGEYLSARNPSGCAGPLTAKLLDSQLLLDLDASLVYLLIQLMLGGKAGGTIPTRPPTQIEKQVVTILMRKMSVELERAWSSLSPIEFQFGAIAAGPQLTRMFQPTDAMVAAKFKLRVGEQSGLLNVLIPADACAAFLENMGRSADSEQVSDEARVARAMMDANVHVDVWLDDVSMQLRDLVPLREGHVIKFDHPTERLFACTFNGEPGFSGQVVSTGRKRAFLVDQAGGEDREDSRKKRPSASRSRAPEQEELPVAVGGQPEI